MEGSVERMRGSEAAGVLGGGRTTGSWIGVGWQGCCDSDLWESLEVVGGGGFWALCGVLGVRYQGCVEDVRMLAILCILPGGLNIGGAGVLWYSLLA
jgi:hypothetical protein